MVRPVQFVLLQPIAAPSWGIGDWVPGRGEQLGLEASAADHCRGPAQTGQIQMVSLAPVSQAELGASEGNQHLEQAV